MFSTIPWGFETVPLRDGGGVCRGQVLRLTELGGGAVPHSAIIGWRVRRYALGVRRVRVPSRGDGIRVTECRDYFAGLTEVYFGLDRNLAKC